MRTNLFEIEKYLKTLLDEGYKLHSPEYADKVSDKFNLTIVSIEGTTRVVFKKKGSRTVIKVGYQCHNRAEYAAYKALEHSALGDLLAPCLGISNEGYALEMAYIPKPIPSARGEYYWFNREFSNMRDRLESHFSFIKGYNKYSWGSDFHEENLRAEHNGTIKIIDYSNLLADMFSRRKATTVSSAIRGVCKLDFPKVNIKLYLKGRTINYDDGSSKFIVAIDPKSKKAC